MSRVNKAVICKNNHFATSCLSQSGQHDHIDHYKYGWCEACPKNTVPVECEDKLCCKANDGEKVCPNSAVATNIFTWGKIFEKKIEIHLKLFP